MRVNQERTESVSDAELLRWWKRRRNELAVELSEAQKNIKVMEELIAETLAKSKQESGSISS